MIGMIGPIYMEAVLDATSLDDAVFAPYDLSLPRGHGMTTVIQPLNIAQTKKGVKLGGLAPRPKKVAHGSFKQN